MLKQILNIKGSDFLNLLVFPCIIHNTNNEKYGEAPYLLFKDMETFYDYADHCKTVDTLFVYFIKTVVVATPQQLIDELLKDDSLLVPLHTGHNGHPEGGHPYTTYDRAFGQYWIGKLKHMSDVTLIKLEEAYMQGQFPKKFARFNNKHKV